MFQNFEFYALCDKILQVMGVIDSLSAGYRFIIQRLDLLLIPIVLDLLLWLGPRLSLELVLQRLADWYLAITKDASFPAEMLPMVESAAEQMRAIGKQINLLDGLASRQFFHVPSIVSMLNLEMNSSLVELTSPLTIFTSFVLISLAGLLIGVLYLSLLARALPIGNAARPTTSGEFLTGVLRHFWRVLGFVLVGLAVAFAASIPASIVVAIFLLFAPAAALGFAFLGQVIVLVIFLYLYFVMAAIIMDDMPIMAAVRQSLRLVQLNVSRVLGFVGITLLISWGFVFLLDSIAAIQAIAGPFLAIVLNAFIGTGLAMALLIFYRSQVLIAEGKRVTGEFEI